jgi:hypothetical protein
MYTEPVVWDSWNRKVFDAAAQTRGISANEAEQVMTDPLGDEAYVEDWDGYRTIGRTSAARWLVVMWVRREKGRYPLYAREADDMVRRMLEDGDR